MVLVGAEVPIAGTDSIKWIEVSVPTSLNHNGRDISFAPKPKDYAFCNSIGNKSGSIVCRIQKNVPNAIELFELVVDEDKATVGLRINFSSPLSPFAFICASDQISTSAGSDSSFLLYALTVSGVAYLLKISKNLPVYSLNSVLPREEIVELDIHSCGNPVSISSAAAAPGCLVLGRKDGSVGCYQLGRLDPTAAGFVHELRDDSGIGVLWSFVSRSRMVKPVQDLTILEVYGRKLLFVLHSDGIVRIWDLQCFSKIFTHPLSVTPEEATATKLWVGEPKNDSSTVPLAVLWKSSMDVSLAAIDVYRLHYSIGDKIILSVESSGKSMPQEEGECIDVKLTSDTIWILKDNGLVYSYVLHTKTNMDEAGCYVSHEEFVADQLFQSLENSADDIILMTNSVFPSAKDHILPFVSSIFLRRIVHPGVLHHTTLRLTLQDYNKHWSDSEFQSLTVDELKKEIISLVEDETFQKSPMSIFQGWKKFCTCYFRYWCRNNAPCSLILHSSGAIGLIRKNSVSLFRWLETIEILMDGTPEDITGLRLSGLLDDEREILSELLRCIGNISQQLGKTVYALFYESLFCKRIIRSQDIVQQLLKILENGHGQSVGADVAWEKKHTDHKNLRKFSTDMLLLLQDLCKKAASWERVFSVIRKYVEYLVPYRVRQGSTAGTSRGTFRSTLIPAACQTAKVMFEAALDILLFVGYLENISWQIGVPPDDISRIQLELVPLIQDIVLKWIIVLFFCTTPLESASVEEFSSQLSSLQIGSNGDKRSWYEKLRKPNFTLASILLPDIQSSPVDEKWLSSDYLPKPDQIICTVEIFITLILFGKPGDGPYSLLRHSTVLALLLFKHRQYEALEYLLYIVETTLQGEKTFKCIQNDGGDWSVLQHLLGCCYIGQIQHGIHGILKERKVFEAVNCFFRASSGQGASQALQSFSHETGFPFLGCDGFVASPAWKLHYYQWAMQLFEQHNISAGACQFALAALEQVDEALAVNSNFNERDLFNESASTIKGRLWANVFTFTLDLNLFNDAYCAIISNPDEESKSICLRRFIIVLYERGALQVLCGGQFPFIGLGDKVEQELAWKADRSDVLAKPNPYKLLYALEMHQHNWRRAACYIYLYTARLRIETIPKIQQHMSFSLQERLNGLSAAINALNLVHPSFAWIDSSPEATSLHNDHYPSKKAKMTVSEENNDPQHQRPHPYIDIEELENEFVRTSAEYLLSLANVEWTYSGTQNSLSDLVHLLVQTNLYDMAFTVLMKFWKDSALKRELEKVFYALSLKCCPSALCSSLAGNHKLLLASSKDEVVMDGSPDMAPTTQDTNLNSQWETLELYLEKYKGFHKRLPIVVAETLLRMDSRIELPLWLVNMFKDGKRENTWAMTGEDPSPASLLCLYIEYGRYNEATNLLLKYMGAYASMRPVDIINRKRPFATWFPYTLMERLWCQLDDLANSNSGLVVDQCDKLKRLLREALFNHLKLLKEDSEVACSAAS